MRNRISLSFLLLILISQSEIVSEIAVADWQKIATFSTTVSVVKIFANGVMFVGLGRSPGSIASAVGISKSTDLGKSWVDATVPTGDIGEISDFFMRDDLNGFATVTT